MVLPAAALSTRRPSRRSRACYAIARRTLLVQVRRSVAYQGDRSVEDRLTTIGRRINGLARLQRLRPRRGLRVSRITLGRVTVETIRTGRISSPSARRRRHPLPARWRVRPRWFRHPLSTSWSPLPGGPNFPWCTSSTGSTPT